MQDKETTVLSLHTELLRKQNKYAEDLKVVNEKMNRVLSLPKTDSSHMLIAELQKTIVRKTKFQGKFDNVFNGVQSKILGEKPNYEQLEKTLFKLNDYIDKNQKEVDLLNEKITELENNLFALHEDSERQKDILVQQQKFYEKFQAVAQKQQACNLEISKVLQTANAVASKFNLLANAPDLMPEKAAVYQAYVDSISQYYQDLAARQSELDRAITDYSSQTNLSAEDNLKKLTELETKVNELEKESQELAEKLQVLQLDLYEGKNLNEITKNNIKEDATKKIVYLEGERNSLVESQNLLKESIQKLSKGTVLPQKTAAHENQRETASSSKKIDFNQVNNLKQKFPRSLSAEITQRTEKLSGFAEMVRGILDWYPSWAPFYDDAIKFVEEQDMFKQEIDQIKTLQNEINAIPDNSKLEDDSVVAVLDYWQNLKESGLQLSIDTNMLDTLQSVKDGMSLMQATQQYSMLANQISAKQQEILGVSDRLEKFNAVPEEINLAKLAQNQVANHVTKSQENDFSIFSATIFPTMWKDAKNEPEALPPELEEFQQAELRRQAELKSGNPFELYSVDHKSDAEAVIRNRDWPILSRNEDGNTMLHLALQKNGFDRSMINILERTAKSQSRELGLELWKEVVSTPNKQGETPLFLVVSNEHERSGDKETMVEKLMTAGAEVNEKIVQKMIENEDHYMMEILMKQDPSFVSKHVNFSDNFKFWAEVIPTPIDVLDKNGHTLLYAAIEKEDVKTVNKLITYGAKVSDAELNLAREMKNEQPAAESIKGIWARRPIGEIYRAVKDAVEKPEVHITPTPRVDNA